MNMITRVATLAATTAFLGAGTAWAGLPDPGMAISSNDTAVVITDPQNDFLSTKGASWGLVGKNVKANGTIGNIETLLTFPPSPILLSGWIRHEEQIAGASAWLRVPVEEGEIHLFSFRPQYRSWSMSAFKLLFRAILLAPARRAERF